MLETLKLYAIHSYSFDDHHNHHKNQKQKAEKMLIWLIFSSLSISECGSRSQIRTIMISTVYNILGVFLGTTLGLLICIIIAVYYGNLISKLITEKLLTYICGILFLLFSIQLFFIKFQLIYLQFYLFDLN